MTRFFQRKYMIYIGMCIALLPVIGNGRLKYARLENLGIMQDAVHENKMVESATSPSYRFCKMELTDRMGLDKLFATEHFDAVVNLAGQAGVRYSIENPFAYVESNVLGFLNVLENCRHYPVRHLLYASSSSVYGMGNHVPYCEDDQTDKPVSLYADTHHLQHKIGFAPHTSLQEGMSQFCNWYQHFYHQ